VRGDVGRTLAVEAVLGVVLGVVDVETTHVELFSHDGRGGIELVEGVFGSAMCRAQITDVLASAGSAVSDRRKVAGLSDETRNSQAGA